MPSAHTHEVVRGDRTKTDPVLVGPTHLGGPRTDRQRYRIPDPPATARCDDGGMAVLVDTAMWPAHDRLWAHLVSDSSLAELHDFARRAGLPRRGFDLDHYDVPAERIDDLVALGAEPVSAGDLTRRLIASGLRVRARDR